MLKDIEEILEGTDLTNNYTIFNEPGISYYLFNAMDNNIYDVLL